MAIKVGLEKLQLPRAVDRFVDQRVIVCIGAKAAHVADTVSCDGTAAVCVDTP